MKKILVIPDSFKGTLSATQICQIYEEQAKALCPECQVVAVPVADGGEGTVDCFIYALGTPKVEVDVTGPYGEACKAYYTRQGDTAIMEMAMCAGLPQVEGRENPALTTTYGLGSLMRHAMEAGCTRILLGLGGSCTTDCGCGAAAALGVKFFNKDGEEFVPVGGTMNQVEKIDLSGVTPLLKNCRVVAMCDVDNPMFGPRGASYVFAPQKGADEAMVKELDAGLEHMSQVILRDLGKDVSQMAGAGAAGAMGAGVVAFLGGELRPGIEAVLDTVDYEKLLEGADVVFTGEGRIDSQSLHGKVISGVALRAKAKGVPVVAVVGSIGDGIEGAYDLGVCAVFSINRKAEDFSVSRHHSQENLAATVENILRLWMTAGKEQA